MAATIEEIRNKLDAYHRSGKMVKINNSGLWLINKMYNFEPFSIRKTATTLDGIFEKITSQRKGVHNKKYLQSFFPYYVFYDVILDLDGKIVLYLTKERMDNYYPRYVIHVKNEFYLQYKDAVDNLHIKWGGNSTNLNHQCRLAVHERIDDIYFLFHKQYTFNSIAERRGFKQELIDQISIKLHHKKDLHLQKLQMPF